MAYEDAFLTNHQHLLFDTGDERIDLTMRVDAGGWAMVTGNINQELIEPLTRRAVFRIEAPTDWGLQISGMYYNDEIPRVRAVRSAQAAFALGKQFNGNPVTVPTAEVAYFLCGHVMTEGIPIDASGGIVKVGSVRLSEREPLVYGEDWTEKVTIGSAQTAAVVYSGALHTIDLANGLPVLVYDLREFTQYQANTAALYLMLRIGTVGAADEQTLRIPIPATEYRLDGVAGGSNRDAQGAVGFIDLDDVAFSSIDNLGTAGAALSAWPVTGSYSLHVGAAFVTNDTLDIGVGYGYRQVASDS